MKIHPVITIILVSVLFLAACTGVKKAPATRTLTWTNPIIDKYLADPCVYYDNGYYYLFATGKAPDGRGVQIYRSPDLRDWTFVRGAVEPGDSLAWNWKHFWAPEVIEIDGKFYLYYTASPKDSPSNSGNRVGAAVADSIQGPYRDLGVVVRHASIDGHPFIDKDGKMYIYYTIEHLNEKGLKAGNIYVETMTSPTETDGNPVKIYDKYDWQEGPVVQNIDGKYIMTFSQGAWTNETYNVRYATADSPLGPFTEGSHVILQSNEMVKGPGHHFLFKDESGRDWMAYHGWDTAFTARYPRIDPITITKDTIYMDGPTYTEQSIEIIIERP